MKETLHLLASRANAEHIFQLLAELDAGKGEICDLVQPWGSPFPNAPGLTVFIGRMWIEIF
ncbi:MAG: hypothetical protein LCH61_02470 [Proteobacteria bacterium]|nr:hypothetical protein [Pseudomonadota bacterium]